MSSVLSELRNHTRKIIGNYFPTNLTDGELDQYLNDFYYTTFLQDTNLEQTQKDLILWTKPDEGRVYFPKEIENVFVPITCNERLLDIYARSYNWNLALGRGFQTLTVAHFDGTWSHNSNEYLSPNTLSVVWNDLIVSDLNEEYTEEIQRLSMVLDDKVLEVSFQYFPFWIEVVVQGSSGTMGPMTLNYLLSERGFPTSGRLCPGYLELYPIPDNVYQLKMRSYQKLNAVEEQAHFKEWKYALIYGTSIRILQDNMYWKEAQNLAPLYQLELDRIMRVTLKSYGDKRSYPSF